MHSIVSLSAGVLRLNLREQDEDINVDRWHQVLEPAVGLLQAQGGGEVVVPHRPGELGSS